MRHITIFLKNGKTLRFEDVSRQVLYPHQGQISELRFDYVSMSNGKKNSAVFYANNMSGWAISEIY